MTFKSLISVPLVHQEHIIEWYHISLLHAEATCMLNTIGLDFGWQGICKQVDIFVRTCDKCQKYKITGKQNDSKIPLKSTLQTLGSYSC